MNSRTRSLVSVLGLTIAATLAAEAQGAVIIGNVAGAANFTGTASTIDSTASKGIGFRMSETVDITSLTLVLKDVASTDSALNTVLPRIYTQKSSGTFVGTLMGSFVAAANPTLTDTATSYTFAPTAGIRLSADTSYWLFLIGSSPDGYTWCNSSPTLAPTGSYATSTGARYASTSAQPTLEGGSSGNYNSFQLDGTVVPEPATGLSLMVGGACLLAGRRRTNHG